MKLSKWHKIILSVLIIGVIGLVVYIGVFGQQSKLGPNFELFAYFFFEWAAFGFLGIIAFTLRKLKIVKDKENFLYILIGTCNVVNAGYCCFLINQGAVLAGLLEVWLLAGATGCLAFLIFVDIFL